LSFWVSAALCIPRVAGHPNPARAGLAGFLLELVPASILSIWSSKIDGSIRLELCSSTRTLTALFAANAHRE
jgi:hypothetical protein